MRSILHLTNSRFGRIFQLVVMSAMAIALMTVFAQTMSAQCVEHPDKKTALKFNNETSFELTFFVDDDEEGVAVASRTMSNELETEPGEHLLRARAVVKGEAVFVWVVNEILAGEVYTWTITDPPTYVAADSSKNRTAIAAGSERKKF